jgi:glycosyltransferase involved in cell wall biosynthesis
MTKQKQKICFVLTVDYAVKAFLLNHLRALSQFYDITVIVNTDNPNFLAEAGIKAKVIPLKIAREISLFADLICLFKLIHIFHHQRFIAVHSMMPKSGLLAMLAALIVRIPLRTHTFTGQVWATKVGFKRFFLKQFDCLIAFLSTNNIVDSPSQRQFLLDNKVIKLAKSAVYSKGSISGVEITRFKPNLQTKTDIRQQLGIPVDAMIFLFIGRLNEDKGVMDLAHAFKQLNISMAHSVCVGQDEQNMQAEMMNIVGINSSNVHFVAHTNMPEAYMAAADVLCLPSYREGFGMVIIEAAAVGIPSIASRIYGIADAVVDGETGLLHAPRDVEGIKNCMQTLIDNKSLRLKLGEQARARAIKDFDSNAITQEWVKFYQENVH